MIVRYLRSCIVIEEAHGSATFPPMVLVNMVSQNSSLVGSYITICWVYGPRGLVNKISIP